MKKKPRKGSKDTKPQTKIEKIESFFNFFTPPLVRSNGACHEGTWPLWQTDHAAEPPVCLSVCVCGCLWASVCACVRLCPCPLPICASMACPISGHVCSDLLHGITWIWQNVMPELCPPHEDAQCRLTDADARQVVCTGQATKFFELCYPVHHPDIVAPLHVLVSLTCSPASTLVTVNNVVDAWQEGLACVPLQSSPPVFSLVEVTLGRSVLRLIPCS